ncbi:sensor domain-containing diguanylate cyclase [Sphingomonas sp. UBA978]|nr:GGDEF domain-containing protein [Sphingomonas sp. UBA978]
MTGIGGTSAMHGAMAARDGNDGRGAAVPFIGSRMSRLSAWIGGAAIADAGDAGPIADPERDGHRALFADIGAFLDRHALEPSVAHYQIARTYILRESHPLSCSIDDRLFAGGTIDAAFLHRLTNRPSHDPLSPERIADMADALAARLTETECTFRQSHASARDYEQALTVEAGSVDSDPDGTVKRLLALTTQAIARNRLLADRLEETHRETNQLRRNLHDARRAADEDHLTGLPNRRCFDRRLHALPATQDGAAPHCVALCDIDDFKAINDRHGHDTGDRVLKLVARHLTNELGIAVLVARHGGEEFACLFEDCTPEVAFDLLDGARAALGGRILVNQTTGDGIGRITFSAGVASLGDDPGAAMRAADAALYAAKRAGKNRIAFPPEDDVG